MERQAHIERKTSETDISLSFCVDGGDACSISSGLPFMDHMLTAWSRHGRFGLTLDATGDLEVDAHHTMEDIGLVLGQAIREALGDKRGIVRFGSAFVPMDEALARVVIDLSGRPHLSYRVQTPSAEVGGIGVRLFREFFQALVNTSAMTLHVDLLTGEESHHIVEAIFKAFGRALDQATSLDPCCTDVPSTKGVLE